MDILLMDGDHYVDGRGLPVTAEGEAEIIQRALIRLAVRKGSFPLDPGLGSELYRLGRQPVRHRDRIALSYVQEALAPMEGVQVRGVSCLAGEAGLLRVAAEIACEGNAYQLEVTVQG